MLDLFVEALKVLVYSEENLLDGGLFSVKLRVYSLPAI